MRGSDLLAGKREAQVTFKANTSQFTAGIKQMDNQLKSLRSELKLNATQMKGAGESTDLLKNRQNLLKGELSSTREKIALLSNKLSESKRIFGENSEETRKLQRELINTKNTEAGIQNELSQTNAKLKEQERANSDLEQSISKADAKLKQLDQELQLNSVKLEGTSKKTELLKERQALLGNQAKATSEKIQSLEKALDTCGKEVGENSDEYAELKSKLLDAKKEQAEIQNEISKTNEKLKEQKSSVENAGESIGNFADKLDKAAGKTRGISTAAAGSMAAMGTAAVSFESAFAGVMKTTDEVYDSNGKCTYSYQQLEDGIRSMAKEIPASTKEISEVAEVAGQLGIKTEDILGFTRTMIDMGQSTNLASEEAASSIAKFANITGLAADESMSAEEKYKRVGSTIVELGNNYATTEADIMEMAKNLASAGTQVGMSESDILAMATALSSVGMEAQAGGTAFSKAMIEMQLAVETNSESLNDWASVAGMSADEFATKFKTDATGALEAFIKGLSNCGGETDSAIKVLDEMGITETRMRDALLRSANASDVFTSAVKTGKNAWKENTALTEEAEKRYKTTSSQIGIMKNHLYDAGITLGSVFLPIISDVTKKVSGFADKVAGLDKRTQRMIIGVLGVIALIFPVLSGISKISSGISGLIGIGGKLVGAFKGTAVAAEGAGAVTSAAMSAPILPIIGIIAAITAVIGIFVLLWNKSESFRDFFTGMWDGLKSVIDGFLDKINFGEKIDAIKERFSGLGEKLKGLEDLFKIVGTVVAAILVPAIGIAAGLFNALLNAIEPIITIIGGAIDILSGLGQMIVGVFTGDLDKAKGGVELFISGVGEIFGGLWDLVKGVLSGFLTGIKDFFVGLADKCGITDFITKVGEKLQNLGSVISDFFQGIWDKIKSFGSTLAGMASSIFQTIGDAVQVGILFIGSVISAGWQIITLPFQFIWQNCKDFVIEIWNNICQKINDILSKISEIITKVCSDISSFSASIWDGIRNIISSIWKSISSIISNVVGTVKSVISEGFNLAKKYIINPISEAYSKVSGFFGSIKSTISGATGEVKSTVSAGFSKAKSYIINPISEAYSSVSEIFNNIKSTISNKINQAKDIVHDAIEKIKSLFNFSWSLPHLDLPHFSIVGEFSLKPPRVPHLSVDWYAKGAIFRKATIMQTNSGLKGVGEAGAEAVLPISNLITYVEDAMQKIVDTRLQRENIDYDKLAEAMSHYKMSVVYGKREFGRIVRETI